MIRWLNSLFAWRLVRSADVWNYWENEITGRRAAYRNHSGGYAPIDFVWLLAGSEMPLIDGIPAWRSRHRGLLPNGMTWR